VRYRVYYTERMPRGARDWMRTLGYGRAGARLEELEHEQTEWEEQVDAESPVEALDAFMRDHAGRREDVMLVDEFGESRPLEGIEDFDPGRSYVWIEDDKLMEYAGMDESTPGMSTCPLCDGEGEVPDDVAEEFLADMEEDEEGEVTAGG
jgi:hypothetical protein